MGGGIDSKIGSAATKLNTAMNKVFEGKGNYQEIEDLKQGLTELSKNAKTTDQQRAQINHMIATTDELLIGKKDQLNQRAGHQLSPAEQTVTKCSLDMCRAVTEGNHAKHRGQLPPNSALMSMEKAAKDIIRAHHTLPPHLKEVPEESNLFHNVVHSMLTYVFDSNPELKGPQTQEGTTPTGPKNIFLQLQELYFGSGSDALDRYSDHSAQEALTRKGVKGGKKSASDPNREGGSHETGGREGPTHPNDPATDLLFQGVGKIPAYNPAAIREVDPGADSHMSDSSHREPTDPHADEYMRGKQMPARNPNWLPPTYRV